jgi:HPt (histidine-containing phosphotransfer) domain-containing protein
VIEVFLSECPKLMDDLRAAIDGEDAPRVKLVAHTIKGSITLFCAEEAAAAAYQLETWGQDRDITSVRAAMPAFEARVNHLTRTLTQFAAGPASVAV